MSNRTTTLPRSRATALTAVLTAGMIGGTLAGGALPAQAASSTAPATQPVVIQAPLGNAPLGTLTSAAFGHPLPGVSLNAFVTAPGLVEKAAAAQERAAKKAAAKKAAAQRLAAKKAAAKKAAAKKAAAKKAAAKKAKAARAAEGRSSRSSGRVGGSPRAIARDMLASRGWGSGQFQCLDNLWNKESDWLPTAQNPSSSAYGIPQALPGSKMASAGSDWRTNPATQIRWGLGYIADRYGSPCSAWAHSQANNWY